MMETKYTPVPELSSEEQPHPGTKRTYIKLQGWPTKPKPIRSTFVTILLNTIFDISLIACSAAFLAFALLVNAYDRAPTSENPKATSNLVNASKYAPTVFPILFASVIGRAAHAILLWRLEKGERIGILDTLASSTSLTSAVTTQVQLRMISFLGIMLIALWALSPAGGQASIRQISIGSEQYKEQARFQMVVPNGPFTELIGSSKESPFSLINSIFLGGLISPWKTRTSPVDTWGNVKILRIENYEASRQPDQDGWYLTDDSIDEIDVYTSFIGTPVSGKSANSTTTDYIIDVQAPYLDLRCRTVDDLFYQPNRTFPVHPNNITGTGAFIWWSIEEPERSFKASVKDLKPRNFTYVPIWGSKSAIQCSVTTTYVEMKVFCMANSTCTPGKVRRSKLDHLQSAFTFFDIHPQQLYAFLDGFMRSTPGDLAAVTYLDRYLMDPRLSIKADDTYAIKVTSWPGDKELSIRFGQLFNAYFISMNGAYSLTGGINNDTSYYWDTNITYIPPLDPTSSTVTPASYNWTRDKLKSRVWSTNGTMTTHTEVIIAHKAWVGLLSIASIVLILCSLVSPFIRYFVTKGPDIAMNISSLATRNNEFIPIPNEGTYLHASDRAKLLKNVKLRLGDINAREDSGTLVIAIPDIEGVDVREIKKERLFQ